MAVTDLIDGYSPAYAKSLASFAPSEGVTESNFRLERGKSEFGIYIDAPANKLIYYKIKTIKGVIDSDDGIFRSLIFDDRNGTPQYMQEMGNNYSTFNEKSMTGEYFTGGENNRNSDFLWFDTSEKGSSGQKEEFKVEFYADRDLKLLIYSSPKFQLLPAPQEEIATPDGDTYVTNNVVNTVTNVITTNINNSGSGNILVGDIGSINNATSIYNSFIIQTTNINLSIAISGDSKKSEKVEGTDQDDLIADGLGKDKLIGGEGADQFYFSGDEPFKKKTVDKVIDFDSSEGDQIVIADEVISDLDDGPSLAIADTRKDLKQLSQDGYDLLYFEPKGYLYLDGNGGSKGFGKKSEGGMIADLPNNTTLTESDVLIGV